MRPLSGTSFAGLGGSGVVAPALISPKAGDTFQLADQVAWVAAFGTLTDLLSPLAPIAAISKVEFFDGVTKIGEATAFPWILYSNASGLGVGAHTLKCRVTYVSGAVLDSSTVAITVAAAPATNPGAFAAVKLWADASDLTKYTPANPTPGTLVSALANNQGTAVFGNFAQATGAQQPTVDWLRGQPCLAFGGQLQSFLLSAITGSVAQPWQVFVPARQLGAGTTGTVFAGGTGGNYKVNGTASDWPMDAAFNANLTITAAAAIPDSTAHVMDFEGNGASSSIQKDGVNVASGTAGTRTLATNFSVGAGNTGAAAVLLALGEVVVSTGLSSTDKATVRNLLIAKYHTSEPAGKRFDAGDSITVGQGSTNGMGDRYMCWFASNGVPWKFSQAKLAGSWVESHGPFNSGSGGRPGFVDDQEYGNSGKGINFMLANLGARINAGQPYAGMDFTVLAIGTNNARSLAGETFVPGTGAGSTFESWVNLGILVADAMVKGFVWLNLLDSNPAFGTGAGSTWANIRTMNAYFMQAVEAVRAARPAKKIVPVDQFNWVGPWNSTDFSDEVHPADPGYVKIGKAKGQGIVQLLAL